MKFEVNVEKRYAFMILAGLLLVVGVYAYGGNQPQVIGHSTGEVDLDLDGNGVSEETLNNYLNNIADRINIDTDGDGIADSTLQNSIDTGDIGGAGGCNIIGSRAQGLPGGLAVDVPSECIDNYCRLILRINRQITSILYYQDSSNNNWFGDVGGNNGDGSLYVPMMNLGAGTLLWDDQIGIERVSNQWSLTGGELWVCPL